MALYQAMRAEPDRNWTPRVKIFAGKAAASYRQAKLIIKFINDIARVVNNDRSIRDLLKVVFIPNYNVSAAEQIVPASDLSEQISTAGMEASGTGNMKLALNGAITIGTLDGANIEIRDHVGDENIFIFGMRSHEVMQRRARGLDATDVIERSPVLNEVISTRSRTANSRPVILTDLDRSRTACVRSTTISCRRTSTIISAPSARSTRNGSSRNGP